MFNTTSILQNSHISLTSFIHPSPYHSTASSLPSNISNIVFTSIYCAEAAAKIAAFSFRLYLTKV